MVPGVSKSVLNKAFRHVETLFIQGRNLVQNLFTIYIVKETCEWTGVNLFDYVNSKEVLIQDTSKQMKIEHKFSLSRSTLLCWGDLRRPLIRALLCQETLVSRTTMCLIAVVFFSSGYLREQMVYVCACAKSKKLAHLYTFIHQCLMGEVIYEPPNLSILL